MTSRATPTISTTSCESVIRLPIGLSPGQQKRSARVWLTTATGRESARIGRGERTAAQDGNAQGLEVARPDGALLSDDPVVGGRGGGCRSGERGEPRIRQHQVLPDCRRAHPGNRRGLRGHPAQQLPGCAPCRCPDCRGRRRARPGDRARIRGRCAGRSRGSRKRAAPVSVTTDRATCPAIRRLRRLLKRRPAAPPGIAAAAFLARRHGRDGWRRGRAPGRKSSAPCQATARR